MAEIPRLEDLAERLSSLDGKRILVRTDFNVPLDGGVENGVDDRTITDDFRIRSASRSRLA